MEFGDIIRINRQNLLIDNVFYFQLKLTGIIVRFFNCDHKKKSFYNII